MTKSITVCKKSLIVTVKGLLRIGISKYKLELRRSMLEILSDIYYRIYIFYITSLTSMHCL
jgi:hypothetical protein